MRIGARVRHVVETYSYCSPIFLPPQPASSGRNSSDPIRWSSTLAVSNYRSRNANKEGRFLRSSAHHSGWPMINHHRHFSLTLFQATLAAWARPTPSAKTFTRGTSGTSVSLTASSASRFILNCLLIRSFPHELVPHCPHFQDPRSRHLSL